MNIIRENIDELNGVIRVSIEKADFATTVEQVLNDHRKKMNMPGFRPGKIPLGLVKKMYGKSILVDEINKLLTKGLTDFIFNEKLDILGEPLPNTEQQKTIDWDNDTEFEFVFDIGFAPEVKISLDKRSKFPFYKIKVSEELIDNQADAYASRFGSNQSVEIVDNDVTIRGDIVQLDENNNVKEDGISAEMALISIKLIKDEEIRDCFIGKNIEEDVVFDLKKAYPNNTEIAYLMNIEKDAVEGMEGNFKITIKEINKFSPAIINAELYRQIWGEDTEVKDEKTFRHRVAEEIGMMYAPSSEYKFSIDARDILVSKVKMDFPEAFLKRWLMATNEKLTQEQLETDFEHFMEDLKWQVIKENITKDNDLKVEEIEVLELAKQIAASQYHKYGMFDIPDEYLESYARKMVEKKEDKSRLFNKKMEDKIMEVIQSKVTIEEKVLTKEEFDKFFEKK